MKLFNSAIVTAPLGVVERGGDWRPTRFPVRYGLIEGSERMLVDTGYGPRVLTGTRSPALRLYAGLLRPRLEPFAIREVDTLLLTHFHADHVARLRDIKHARILAGRGAIARYRNMSAAAAVQHGIFEGLLPREMLASMAAIEDLPPRDTRTSLGYGHDLGDGRHVAVALPGHAPGHYGIFFEDDGMPTLYATDVAWTIAGLEATPKPTGRLVFDDLAAAAHSMRRVKAFIAEGGRALLCHDPNPI